MWDQLLQVPLVKIGQNPQGVELRAQTDDPILVMNHLLIILISKQNILIFG